MPPEVINTTRTPEEEAELRAKRKLSEWGFTHSGNVIDYDEAVAIIKEIILNQ